MIPTRYDYYRRRAREHRDLAQGADPAFLGSEEFGKFLQGEMPRWAAAVKASGTKLD